MKTYRNKNGYEITLPKCMNITWSDSDEHNVKPEDLADAWIKDKCSEEQHRKGMVIITSQQGFLSKNEAEINKSLANIRTSTQLNHRLKAKNILYLSTPEAEKELGVEVFYVEELGFKELRWIIYKRCGLKLFEIIMGSSEKQVPANPKLKENILNGKELVPELQRKIIQSFKCL